MAKVTNEDILRINEIYYKTHTYAETARQTGFAASTVKKYVIPGWKPITEEQIRKFELSFLPEFDTKLFRDVETHPSGYGAICILSDEEIAQVKELWKELSI